MVTLIPTVAFMTVAGPAIGSALFAYGNFGDVDAGYLGMAITLSAFTLLPYALVLLQLRVFYAREQPWTPIVVIVVITTVKIAASLAAPNLTDDRELVAGYLGLANGIGFLAGAIVGYILLRANLNPPRGRLVSMDVVRTVLVVTTASLLAGLLAHVVDQLLGLESLTEHGGAGSMLRLLVLGTDHAADHRRGDACRAGARSAGGVGGCPAPARQGPESSRAASCAVRPTTPGGASHVL